VRIKKETIAQSSGPVDVSTVTPLLPFTDLSDYQIVFLAVQNLGPNEVTVFFETSEDGISVDATLVYTYTIQTGQQCSLEISPDNVRSYYSITAQTDAPSFPTSQVTFQARAGMSADWVPLAV